MDEKKRYTSGELAEAAGLSVRTIQHYDNIGLLPSSPRTENGCRRYTEDDMIRLEQILFFKFLGFSLNQIKGRILSQPGADELAEMLKRQQLIILGKIEQLHTSFATMDKIAMIVKQGKKPPFQILLRLLGDLPWDDVFSQAPLMLTKEQNEALSSYFQDIESVQSFYHRWNEAVIEAAVLKSAGIPADSELAQDLAKRWCGTVFSVSRGKRELPELLSGMHLEDQLLAGGRETLDVSYKYLQKACEIFNANSGS